jgi:hypothetical protein
LSSATFGTGTDHRSTYQSALLSKYVESRDVEAELCQLRRRRLRSQRILLHVQRLERSGLTDEEGRKGTLSSRRGRHRLRLDAFGEAKVESPRAVSCVILIPGNGNGLAGRGLAGTRRVLPGRGHPDGVCESSARPVSWRSGDGAVGGEKREDVRPGEL